MALGKGEGIICDTPTKKVKPPLHKSIAIGKQIFSLMNTEALLNLKSPFKQKANTANFLSLSQFCECN